MYSISEFKKNLQHVLYSSLYVGPYNSQFLVMCVIVNAMHFTVCYECNELSFFFFLNFFSFIM